MSTAALPKAIQRQLDEAEQIEKAIANRGVSEVEQPGTDPEPEVVTPAPVPAPAPVVETHSQPAAETERRDSDDAVYWRKRFETVQGMLNAEVKRIEQSFADKVSVMQKQFEQAVKQAPAQLPQSEALISSKDEEAFGSDLIDLARRAAREEFGRLAAGLVGEIRKELTPVREQVGKVAERQEVSEQDRFYQTLTALVPDWEKINADTRWLEWLAEVDPMLGAPRQVALDSAHNTMDVQRVAAVFNTWKNQFMPKQAKNTNRELERQVAPPKSGGSAATPVAPKVWTRAEYERAFDPRLTRSLSQAEIAQLQADADRAHQEGRIRW